MASAAVRFHPAAAQEAESTYDWYAARSPEAAHGFPRGTGRATTAIETSPPSLATLWQPRAPMRISAIPLQLVYILRGEDIEVVAVAHGRRRPGYWRPRSLIGPLNFRMQRAGNLPRKSRHF